MSIIHDAYKFVILESVIGSQSLRDKLTFKEQLKLLNHVDTLSQTECKALVQELGIPEFQSKFKNALKYGAAAIAGGIVAPAGVSIVMGATLGMLIRYIFRKTTDPCWKACITKNIEHKQICKHTCHMAGCDSVIKDISNQIGKCGKTKNPKRCRKSLELQRLKWAKKKETSSEQLHKAQDKYVKKTAKQRLKDKVRDAKIAIKRKKANEAREQLVSIVIHSDKLKDKTTFDEQLNILNWVWDAPNYKILEFDDVVKHWKKDPPIPKAPVKKALKLGFAVAAVVIPGGIVLNQAAGYLVDSYNYKCQKMCQESEEVDNKNLCYKSCKHKANATVTKAINNEYATCDKTNGPVKCRKRLRTLMFKYRKRTLESKMRFDQAVRKSKQKEMMGK